ncbi:ribosome biogenesis GTPase Der [bacterium]|nr:ribosome biogenesis GTPase Der [bacterium]
MVSLAFQEARVGINKMLTIHSFPTVVVVGRPNVGKSTFVNRMLGSYRAITLDEPGVTRDVLSYMLTFNDRTFLLLDSAGLDPARRHDPFFKGSSELAMAAVSKASQVLMMVDATCGVTGPDMSLATQLRSFADKVTVVVNKSDGVDDNIRHDFYSLGLGEPHMVSAKTGAGLEDIMTRITHTFAPQPVSDAPSPLSIALFGKPNVGKSSIMNALLGREQSIVSDIPGTTRDPVPAHIRIHDTPIQLIDTAGLKKAKQIDDGIDYYASRRSMAAMTSSFLTVVVLDASNGLSDQDKRLIRLVIEAGRRLLVLINKADMVTASKEEMIDGITSQIPALAHYPILVGSATNRSFLTPLLQTISSLLEHQYFRISTPELNQFLDTALRRSPPRSKSGVVLKLYYATQVASDPPELLLFVNHPHAVGDDYTRFIERRLRHAFPQLWGTPIRIVYKARRPART